MPHVNTPISRIHAANLRVETYGNAYKHALQQRQKAINAALTTTSATTLAKWLDTTPEHITHLAQRTYQ